CLILGAAALAGFGCATSVENPGSGGSSSQGGNEPGTGGATASSASASSSGQPGPCVKASDCPPIQDPCNIPACINGACAKQPANDFGACEDGLFCTINDTCMSGVCVAGTQKVCPALDA